MPVEVWTSSHAPTPLAAVSVVAPAVFTVARFAVVASVSPSEAYTLISASAVNVFVVEVNETSVLDMTLGVALPESVTSACLMTWEAMPSAW